MSKILTLDEISQPEQTNLENLRILCCSSLMMLTNVVTALVGMPVKALNEQPNKLEIAKAQLEELHQIGMTVKKENIQEINLQNLPESLLKFDARFVMLYSLQHSIAGLLSFTFKK